MNVFISHPIRKILLPIMLVGSAILGCGTVQASESSGMPEFDVRWQMSEFGNKLLQVVSRNNEITIDNISVNRGNCSSIKIHKTPITLGFGKVFKVYVEGACEILEVSIITNKGEVTYNFES